MVDWTLVLSSRDTVSAVQGFVAGKLSKTALRTTLRSRGLGSEFRRLTSGRTTEAARRAAREALRRRDSLV